MKKLLLLFFALVIGAGTSFGQLAKIQALYIFQFAKYTGWSRDDAGKQFVITVLGDESVADELRKAAEGKNIGGRSVEVVYASSTGRMPESDVIYIGERFGGATSSVANSQAGRLVLIIGGAAGMCEKGASVALIPDKNRVTFEFSERNLSKRSLHVAPKLLAMGKAVQ